ncbi:MAG TPA: hypothetical protein VGR78_07635, partial [Verrucomicrobiae bacterium]|nr:hypothetical protein [Verrucomicrobiae bacterium]
MNRSVLIVICDFLLLMLLASSRLDQLPSINSNFPDRPEIRDYSSVPPVAAAAAPKQTRPTISARTADLLDSMRTSLEQEHSSREQLAAILSQTEDALRAQQQLAAEREAELHRKEMSLRSKEEEARQIEQARNALAANLQQAQTNLTQIQHQLEATSLEARLSQTRLSTVEKDYAAAQTNLVQLEKQVSSSGAEARLARERLAQIENDLRSRQAEADEARQRIQQVEQMRHAAELEREKIAGQLKVAESEKTMTRQELESAKGQIQTVQKEKAEIQKVAAELAEGVVKFATNEALLAKEIHDNRPLTANLIFSQFLTNRVNTDFRANRTGILGRTISRDSQTKTVLLSDGTQTYALYHVDDTPFRIEDFGKDWERLFVHLYRGNAILPVPKLQFLSMDPRIVVAPVT